jgi:hypothetical protein
MTRARIDRVAADADTAGRLLGQARNHLGSAALDGVDAESAYGLSYQAALKALAAALTFAGMRASSGAGSHVVLLREATRLVGLDANLANRIDRMRRTRHAVFYEAEEVSGTELRSALSDAAAVIEAVERRIG